MILLVIVVIAAVAYGAHQFYKNQRLLSMAYNDEEHNDSPPPPDLPSVSFGDKPSSQVLGWPSTGGVLVLQTYNGLDLDFLGLDRFNSTLQSHDPIEQDVHCDKMRRLGAVWFESVHAWDYYTIKSYTEPDLYEPVIITGWPITGGVWALKMTTKEARIRGCGRLSNALDMDERCKMIEMLGGSFYADPEDCVELSLSSDSPIEEIIVPHP
ncbi:hypothetical protein EJ08DRAFT_333767 [Tothia fuscella]|uniref:Uncharacterized protein n=1 Tax=Tothia fuscella TaxID=1048955 RepID=A0A9P4P106_9PEZI|nr:hypothetical protein EJ08DRAFT_333767 [Tothia fuscella]